MIKPLKIVVVYLMAFFVFAFNSCTLLKIESSDKPLSTSDINTRFLVQSFARDALNSNELAADSIINLAKDQKQLQLQAIRWKLHIVAQLSKLSFQPIARVALTDTWAYMLKIQNFLSTVSDNPYFGEFQHIALITAETNVKSIEEIAGKVLNIKDFPRYKEFVEIFAFENPLQPDQDLYNEPIRGAYLAFKGIPDSSAMQTLGTLSQVVDEASNKFSFSSDILGKKLNWQVDLILKEQGLDSIPLETRLAILEHELNRLADVAVNSPEILSQAMLDFKQKVQPLFEGLNTEIASAVLSLSRDREALDQMVLRERLTLDTLIKREREALTKEAKVIADTGIKNFLAEMNKLITTILFFLAIVLVIILGLPFYLGYITGKRSGKALIGKASE
jgi:hypothetical protein